MNILVAYCLLVSSVVYAFVTSKYVVGAVLAFGVIVVETVVNIPRDSVGTFFTLSGMVAITVLVIMEGKKRAKDSVLIRYNPFYKENVIPKNIQIIICTILSLALLVRVVTFFCPAEDVNRGHASEQYRKEANAFINKVVIGHKEGEDYHSIARRNPFTNDVFVCKVVALLDSEYGRVDAMKLSISNAMQSAAATRKEELARLSADCLEESSNVVQRITAADIGEVNAKKMAMDFSTYYIKLHQKCSKAVANME